MQLDGKLVVITGAGRGIGRAMALAFARKRCNLALLDLNPADLDRTRELCDAESVRARVYICNVTREDDVSATLDAVVQDFGRLDVMINNAGITKDALLVKVQDGKVVGKMSLDQWRAVTSVNLDGVFVTLREAARQMVDQGGGGALVAVSSTSSLHGAPRQAHYAASKAGVLALVRSMAVGFARHRIRANSLVPGWTLTDLTEAGYQYDKFRENTIRRTPVRRWGTPADFRAVAPFLCDPRLEFHTGDEVTIDGGYTVY